MKRLILVVSVLGFSNFLYAHNGESHKGETQGPSVRSACQSEIRTYCTGSSAIDACLRDKWQALSYNCKTALHQKTSKVDFGNGGTEKHATATK